LSNSHSSTARLIQLCFGYFFFYVITGIAVKFFLSTGEGYPGLPGMEYLVYNTAGGAFVATGVVLVLKWYKLDSLKSTKFLGITMPVEIPYIIASGVCTAVVIPTTTLMYSFRNISVMVAMVVMRGAVIIIGRIVDAIQIKQGILTKKVYFEENIAMVFALVAVGVKLFVGTGDGKQSPFSSLPVIIIFSAYITAYAIRIYIMNYYKNTRKVDAKKDNNKAFFAIEQISSTVTLMLVTVTTLLIIKYAGITGERSTNFMNAFVNTNFDWMPLAFLAGIGFGIVAFFSVFIFMFKGRTATFAGLVNRLTSLIAGTVSTLIFAVFFTGSFPHLIDWISLIFIVIAVGFMAKAEKKRQVELAVTD
jgi:hypothetical protein